MARRRAPPAVLPHLLDLRRPALDPFPFAPHLHIALHAIHPPRRVHERMIRHAARIRALRR